MIGLHLVVAIGPQEKQRFPLRILSDPFHQLEGIGVHPLKVVQKNNQRMGFFTEKVDEIQ